MNLAAMTWAVPWSTGLAVMERNNPKKVHSVRNFLIRFVLLMAQKYKKTGILFGLSSIQLLARNRVAFSVLDDDDLPVLEHFLNGRSGWFVLVFIDGVIRLFDEV